MSSAVRRQTRRFSMRLTDTEISVIDRAATTRSQSRAEFVLDAAVRAAKDAIVDCRVIFLSEEGFDDFMRLTSGPPRVVPAVVELMKRKAPWET